MADERHQKQTGTDGCYPGGRWRCVGVLSFVFQRQEVIAVPYRLRKNERAVQRERDCPIKNKLRRTEARTGTADREIWKYQREDRQRSQHRQFGTSSLQPKGLLVVTNSAPQQASADDAVADDHDNGENRVPRQGRILRGSRQHD